MRKIIIALILSIPLLAASKLPATSNNTDFRLVVHYAPLQDLRKLCKKSVNLFAPGCAKVDKEKRICEIWIPEPKDIDDWTAFQISGHEVWHCILGDFHK